MWVQRIHTEVRRLASRCLYPQSNLNSPVFNALLVGKVESMIAYFILLHQLIHFTRVWVHTSAHVGVREQLWSQLFPPPIWVLGIKRRSSGLVLSENLMIRHFRPMITQSQLEPCAESSEQLMGSAQVEDPQFLHLQSNGEKCSGRGITCEGHLCEVPSSRPSTILRTQFLKLK